MQADSRLVRTKRVPSARAAFTLTELLVVITIIAILAGLASVAVLRGLDTARQTTIKAELDNLDMAIKELKTKFGAYPPSDLTNPMMNVALRQFVTRAFPRYNLVNLVPDLTAAGVDIANYRPDQALVFWLRGFSSDPANPFITVNDLQIFNGGMVGSTVTHTGFDFDKTRLVAAAPGMVPSYFPKNVKADSTGAPFVYFEASVYGPPAGPYSFNGGGAGPFINAGTAVPYWFDTNGNGTIDTNETYCNPDSFQIVACGMDGKFGGALATPRLYPTGTGYDVAQADEDNVTNFCQKARLGDARP